MNDVRDADTVEHRGMTKVHAMATIAFYIPVTRCLLFTVDFGRLLTEHMSDPASAAGEGGGEAMVIVCKPWADQDDHTRRLRPKATTSATTPSPLTATAAVRSACRPW